MRRGEPCTRNNRGARKQRVSSWKSKWLSVARIQGNREAVMENEDVLFSALVRIWPSADRYWKDCDAHICILEIHPRGQDGWWAVEGMACSRRPEESGQWSGREHGVRQYWVHWVNQTCYWCDHRGSAEIKIDLDTSLWSGRDATHLFKKGNEERVT